MKAVELPPEIITLCKRMAAIQARRCGVDVEDLLQECLFAGWLALPRFEPGRGVKLATWLAPRIRGAMCDYLRNFNETVRLPRNALKTGKHRSVSFEAIAALMRHDGTDQERRAADIAHPADDRSPSESLERADWWRFSRQLRGLAQMQRQILRLYYRERLTMREIGEVLGVSESRISQLHTQAIDLLRSQSLTEKRDGYRRSRARR